MNKKGLGGFLIIIGIFGGIYLYVLVGFFGSIGFGGGLIYAGYKLCTAKNFELVSEKIILNNDLTKDNLNAEIERIIKDYNIDEYLQCLVYYLRAIKDGVKPEDARNILPNATKTNITMSVNFRELIHLCNLRLCTRAQLEIRQLFQAIKKEVEKVDERLASLLVPSCEIHGMCFEDKCCGRKPKLQEIMEANKILTDDTLLSHDDWSILMEAINSENVKPNEKLKDLLEERVPKLNVAEERKL